MERLGKRTTAFQSKILGFNFKNKVDLSNKPMVEGCILLELNLKKNDGLVNCIWFRKQDTIETEAHLFNLNRVKTVVFGKVSGLPKQFKQNAWTGLEDMKK
jgi:hypothetical protein